MQKQGGDLKGSRNQQHSLDRRLASTFVCFILEVKFKMVEYSEIDA